MRPQAADEDGGLEFMVVSRTHKQSRAFDGVAFQLLRLGKRPQANRREPKYFIYLTMFQGPKRETGNSSIMITLPEAESATQAIQPNDKERKRENIEV